MDKPEFPPYRLVPMSEAHAVAICAWRYPPPFDRYHWEPWERLSAEGKDCADPEIRAQQYRSVLSDGGLIGFVQWFPMTTEQGRPLIRIGLGLRPDRCGQGLGAGFVTFLVKATAHRYPGHIIDLEVDESNERAHKAYEKAGFTVSDIYDRADPKRGPVRTLCMILQNTD